MDNKKIKLEEKVDIEEMTEKIYRLPKEERMQIFYIMKGFEIARQSKKVLAEGA